MTDPRTPVDLRDALSVFSDAAHDAYEQASFAACRTNGDDETVAEDWLLDGNGSHEDAVWRYGFAAGVRRVLQLLDAPEQLSEAVADLVAQANELRAVGTVCPVCNAEDILLVEAVIPSHDLQPSDGRACRDCAAILGQ